MNLAMGWLCTITPGPPREAQINAGGPNILLEWAPGGAQYEPGAGRPILGPSGAYFLRGA